MLHKVKPAAFGARPASAFVNSQVGGAEDSPSQVSRKAITAELAGSVRRTARPAARRTGDHDLDAYKRRRVRDHRPASWERLGEVAARMLRRHFGGR